MSEDNVIEMPVREERTALQEMLEATPVENLSTMIAGVLEFLTLRALHDGPYYIETDDAVAITVLAANEDAAALRAVLPDNFKSWEQLDAESDEFLSNTDPGDEQDEPATEQE